MAAGGALAGALTAGLGGGLVPGALVLLGGEPGVGKSTLLLEIARRFEGKFLYFSGEESPGQIRIRATRLGVMSSNVQVSRETDLETIALEIEKHKPDIAVIDSIQTVQSAGSSPGSPAILREAAFRLMEAAKSYQDNPTALHLRAMNMLYEGLKEKGAMMIIPSTAVESMGMGGMLGLAAMRQQQLAHGEGDQGKLEPVK